MCKKHKKRSAQIREKNRLRMQKKRAADKDNERIKTNAKRIRKSTTALTPGQLQDM